MDDCFLQDHASTTLGLALLLLVSSTTWAVERGARVVLADLADDFVEGLFDINTSLGGGLEKWASERLGHVLAVVCLDFALVLQIALVAQNDHWVLVLILHTQDLVTEVCDCVK